MGNQPNLVVVDDEPMMLHLLSQTLGSQGFNVLTAPNGVEAFELIKGNPVSLILTDLHMPKGGGLKLLELLRASAHKAIPVIVMSGDADDLKPFQTEGITILRKPFRRRELVELISSILEPAKA
jgi:CheY-like chemotaxis protein